MKKTIADDLLGKNPSRKSTSKKRSFTDDRVPRKREEDLDDSL